MLLFVYSPVACESARSWFVVVLLMKSYIIIFLLSCWVEPRGHRVFSHCTTWANRYGERPHKEPARAGRGAGGSSPGGWALRVCRRGPARGARTPADAPDTRRCPDAPDAAARAHQAGCGLRDGARRGEGEERRARARKNDNDHTSHRNRPNFYCIRYTPDSNMLVQSVAGYKLARLPRRAFPSPPGT